MDGAECGDQQSHGVRCTQRWLREEPEEGQPEVDADDLEEMFEEYGFTVDKYDGVAEDDEAL